MKLKRAISIALMLSMTMSSQLAFATEFDVYDNVEEDVSISDESQGDVDIENPIAIGSALDLFNIRNLDGWNTKSYKLTADIDLNELKSLTDEQRTGELADLVEGETWIPAVEVFYGELDGNGHVVKNLVQKQFHSETPGTAGSIGYSGLFVSLGSNEDNTASVHDLTLENVNIVYDDQINNCTNYALAGGLCGSIFGKVDIHNVRINNEKISASIAGGLIGIINTSENINISECKVNNAEVIVRGIGGQDQNDAGGLIGRIHKVNESETKIENNSINNLVIGFGKYNEKSSVSDVQIGGYIGRFFNKSKLKISDADLNNITITGDFSNTEGATFNMYIGGAFGYVYGQDASNINVNSLSMKISGEKADGTNLYLGGFVGKILLKTSKKVDGKRVKYQTCESKIKDCIVTINGLIDEDAPKYTGFLGETPEYNPTYPIESDVYNAITENVYYDFSKKLANELSQPTGVIPVSYAIAPKTTSSDKAEDASAKDEVLNTKTSAEFVVKAYAVEKNDDGSVKYDETTGEPVVGEEIEGFMDKFGSAVSVTDWKVAAGESIGEGDDAVKCDDAFTADNTTVKADADGMSAVLTSNANAGTKEAPATIIISAKVNGAEKKLAVPYYYVRSSSGGGGGSSSSTPATETTTKTNADGSTTVTVKNNTTGTVTETTTAKDGTKTVVETKKDGTVTTTVTKADGTSLKTVKTADGSTTVNTGLKSPVKVTLPAAGAGTVVVRVKADGSEEIIKDSVVTGSGITFMANDGDVVKIRNNGVSFKDVAAGSWMADAVAYVSGRELFKGVSSDEFGPSGSMTRGMLAAVLYRYAGEPDAATANSFSDVKAGAYYENAVKWAAANGIVTGYADGTFGPDKSVTREQLAAILYRYAGSPQETGTLSGFNDAGSVSDYAANAVSWAVKAGIIAGNGDSATLDPQGSATRAQVATMIKRFAEYRMA